MLSTGAVTTDAGAKNSPLTTAFAPPVRVTRKITWPFTFHTRYCPFWKLETACVSSARFVPASNTSIRSARVPLVSKSRQYKATWCVFPSFRLTSKLKVENVYQPDAIRLVPEDFWSARTSLVELAHTTGPCPVTVQGARDRATW